MPKQYAANTKDEEHNFDEAVKSLARRNDLKAKFAVQANKNFKDNHAILVEIIYGLARLLDNNSINPNNAPDYPILTSITKQWLKDRIDDLDNLPQNTIKQELAKSCCIAGCAADPYHHWCICH